jgi:RimJ/RimL family protein N-acetyltransferase
MGAVPRSLADLDWPVSTDRLAIRPAVPADAPATFTYRSREDVAWWLPSVADEPDTWAAQYTEPGVERQLVIERDGVVIGDLYLHVHDAWSQREVRDRAVGAGAEIGYVLDPAHSGHGYATEAAGELLRICFEELGVRRVTAQLFADNIASRRLLERLGMRREQHTKQDSLHRSGEWMDAMMYALLVDEWRAQRPSS